jgi:hypothetical protein
MIRGLKIRGWVGFGSGWGFNRIRVASWRIRGFAILSLGELILKTWVAGFAVL